MLISSAELLTANGHLTPHANPYDYPVRKLLYLARIHTQLHNGRQVTDSMLHHASRIATVSGEGKLFNDLISNLNE